MERYVIRYSDGTYYNGFHCRKEDANTYSSLKEANRFIEDYLGNGYIVEECNDDENGMIIPKDRHEDALLLIEVLVADIKFFNSNAIIKNDIECAERFLKEMRK